MMNATRAMYPQSSRNARNMNTMQMTGTKPSTVATPPHAPSTTRPLAASPAPIRASASPNSAPTPGTCHDVNGTRQLPPPSSPSFTQSVRHAPGPPSATASHHIAQSVRAKSGSAKIRCVTTRSILSESSVDARRGERVNVAAMIRWT